MLRLLTFVFILFTSKYSLANMSGSSLQNFNPTLNSIGEFTSIYTSKSVGKRQLGLITYFDYAQNTLPIYLNQMGNQDIEDSSLYNNFILYYGLTKNLDIALTSTSILNQEFSSSENTGVYATEGITNLKFIGKYNLLNRIKKDFGLSVITSVSQISVQNTAYHGVDPGISAGVELAADKVWGKFLNSVNIGYFRGNPGDPIAELNNFEPVKNTFTASIGSQYKLSKNFNISSEIHGSKIDSNTQEIDRSSLSLEGLTAINYLKRSKQGRNISFNIGVSTGLNDGISTPSFRIFSGLSLGFGVSKPKFLSKKENKKNRELASKMPPKENLDRVEEVAAEEIDDFLEKDIKKDIEPELMSDSQSHTGAIEGNDEQVATLDEYEQETRKSEFKETGIKKSENITPGYSEVSHSTSTEKRIVLEYIEFEFDSYVLDIKSENILNSVYNYISKEDYQQILIIGHADYVGSTIYNELLSLKRAQSVAQYLARRGIRTQNLTFTGYGKRRLLASGTDLRSRQKNRRVEIILKKMVVE